jgi:hypothetical protein
MGTAPGAVAIFSPSNDGHGAGEGGGANLAFAGWTNKFEPDSKDPQGLIDQETNRKKWVKQDYSQVVDFTHMNVEQIYRVDQGRFAYDGDYDTEEVTANYFDQGVWCFEDIPYSHHWQDVDPGPPEESFCGYTWAPWPAYGGADADYHDREHLFYSVELAQIPRKIIEHQPLEFNQLLTITDSHNDEGGCSPAKYSGDPAWYDCSTLGFPAAVGHLCFTNCTTGVLVTDDMSERLWGIVWGTQIFGGKDYAAGSFPYTNYSRRPFRTTHSKYDPPMWFLSETGVYLAGDYWKDIFAQGAVVYDSGSDWVYTEGMVVFKRDEIDVNARFHPDTIPKLTARQLVILQGNEDAHPWTYDPFTSLYSYTEGEGRTGNGWVSIICGGKIFKIVRQRDTGGYQSSGWDYNYKWTGYFTDYGIFTKVGTGTKFEENKLSVDAKSVDPIYAYCVMLYDTAPGNQDSTRIIYGMVIDDKHYRTEEFEYANGNAVIPEASEAVDVDNKKVEAKLKVRVGVRKPYLINKIAA